MPSYFPDFPFLPFLPPSLLPYFPPCVLPFLAPFFNSYFLYSYLSSFLYLIPSLFFPFLPPSLASFLSSSLMSYMLLLLFPFFLTSFLSYSSFPSLIFSSLLSHLSCSLVWRKQISHHNKDFIAWLRRKRQSVASVFWTTEPQEAQWTASGSIHLPQYYCNHTVQLQSPGNWQYITCNSQTVIVISGSAGVYMNECLWIQMLRCGPLKALRM